MNEFYNQHIRPVIVNTAFQGWSSVVTIIGSVVAFLLSDNKLVKSLGFALGFFALFFVFRILLRALLPKFYNWLIDIKIVFGLFCGLLIGLSVALYFNPMQMMRGAFYAPQIQVLDSKPVDGDTLRYVHSGVIINFSEPVQSRYFYSRFIDAEITPSIPIKLIWLYKNDPGEGCRTLLIESKKYFPNVQYPQFEPNKTYHLKINGQLLMKPYEMVFHTPVILDKVDANKY